RPRSTPNATGSSKRRASGGASAAPSERQRPHELPRRALRVRERVQSADRAVGRGRARGPWRLGSGSSGASARGRRATFIHKCRRPEGPVPAEPRQIGTLVSDIGRFDYLGGETLQMLEEPEFPECPPHRMGAVLVVRAARAVILMPGYGAAG